MAIQAKQIILKNFLVNYLSSQIDNPKSSIIFIHGWQSESNVWLDLINRFSDDYNCYALDLPGFGKSELPKTALTNSDYCNIVEEFAAKLKLENYVFVGHSNGGAIGIKLAARNTEHLQKLILISSAGIRQKSPDTTIKNYIAKILKPLFKPAFMKPLRLSIYKAMGGEDYVNAGSNTKTYINIISEDLTEVLDQIEKPTLLIWGASDVPTPLAFGEIMHSRIKNSVLEVLDGDHFVFLKEKAKVYNLILNFIVKE